MCDLLWSDPDDLNGWGLSPRGAGYLFGGDQVEKVYRPGLPLFVVQQHQQYQVHSSRPSTGDGRVQVDVQRHALHRLVRSELLLQVWSGKCL